MHSGRRGTVTAPLEKRVPRTSIILCGGWTSNTVDEYFHPERLGVKFSKMILR